MHVEIIGAGVAGLCCAREFIDRGCSVILTSRSQGFDSSCCSWWAGGMLAPFCESESAEPLITRLGMEALPYWRRHSSSLSNGGSLVVASGRDKPELALFASRTRNHDAIDADRIATLEPDLSSRFSSGLHYSKECHLDPRSTLLEMLSTLDSCDAFARVAGEAMANQESVLGSTVDWRVDCRGLDARDVLTDLRGVKGEMLIVRAPDLSLNRPIRLLHPRHPVYVVPRGNGHYMIGATTIESDDRQAVSVRSMMELLSSAYALHPAFGEAHIIEMGTDARPAYKDNLPRLRKRGRTLYVNGLYRHGFLCAPAMARKAAELALDGTVDEDVTDEIDD